EQAHQAAPHVFGGTLLEQRVGQRLRSEEHTAELQSRQYLVCRLPLEKKKTRWCPTMTWKTRERTQSPKRWACASELRKATSPSVVGIAAARARLEALFLFFLMASDPYSSTPFPYAALFR